MNERQERKADKRKLTSCLCAKWSRRNQYAIIIVLLGILEFNVIPYPQIGFFCNDPKISFKFTGDTIPMSLLIIFSICVPVIVMWITEYVCHPADSYKNVSNHEWTRKKQIWYWYSHYYIGLATLTFVCTVMKILIGEPRPHFLDTCKPREAANCTDERRDMNRMFVGTNGF